MASQTLDKIFFLHFNKTAGTSLYRFLESLYSINEYIPDSEVAEYQQAKFDQPTFIKRLAEFRLITKLHLHSGYLQQLREYDPSFKAVTVFRQPNERVYSQIAAWRRVPPQVLERVEPIRQAMLMDAREMSVSNFIDKHWQRLYNRQAKMTAGLEQTETRFNDASLLHRAEIMLEKIDYIGLTHGLAELASALAWSLGAFNGFNPQRLNATRCEQKLGSEEIISISKQVVELNSVDLPLYAVAERRAFNLISDTKISRLKARKDNFCYPRISQLKFVSQSMEEPLWGEGWHERERGIDKCARWCGPQRFSSLYLPAISDAPYFIRLYVASILQINALETLRIWLNNCSVPFNIYSNNGFLVIETSPCIVKDRDSLIKIVIENESVESAHRIYSVDDQRLKTIAIERVDAIFSNDI